ncbi:MAG: YqaA family protein [Rhodospirillaceae bacterium]
MIRRLYDWTMRQAERKNAVWVLAAVSFIESSVFPIPPDVLLIPIILANRRQAFMIAGICTVASVVGGGLGYAIGYFLFETLGRQILDFYHAMRHYDAFKAGFDQWGIWIIIIKGMTPIPFKLVTIASGAFKFDLLLFTVAAVISRSMRFFLVAALLWKFGDPVRVFIEKRLTLLTTLFVVLLVGGFLALRLL